MPRRRYTFRYRTTRGVGFKGGGSPAGDTFFIIEHHDAGLRVYTESVDGADSDTGAAVRAFIFITRYVLAKRLYLDTSFKQEIDASIILGLVPFELKHQQAFLLRRDRGLEDIELKVEVFHQLVDNRPVDQALWKAQNYFL